MSNKKYYWLKLKRDFFKRHDIRIIEEMPNGKDYILFYLKMLLESIDHDGQLRFSETIPYNEQMLAVITNTNIDIVRAAMKVFIELNMIDLMDDKTIFMAEVVKMTGSETAGAERVRRHRARLETSQETQQDQGKLPATTTPQRNDKSLHCNAEETHQKQPVTPSNADETKSNTEIELEIEKELEIDTSSSLGENSGPDKTMPFGLTEEEVRESIARMNAIEEMALDLGLPFKQADMVRAEQLVTEHSQEWLMQAMERTGLRERRSWGTVIGILRSWKDKGGIDDAFTTTTDNAPGTGRSKPGHKGDYQPHDKTGGRIPRTGLAAKRL